MGHVQQAVIIVAWLGIRVKPRLLDWVVIDRHIYAKELAIRVGGYLNCIEVVRPFSQDAVHVLRWSIVVVVGVEGAT